MTELKRPRGQPAPASTVGEELTDRIAQWLHDETAHPESYPDYTWPETERDDGQREGGFVKIVPQHAQAYFRDIARRLIRQFPTLSPRSVEAPVACEPTEDQVMTIIRKHGDLFRKAMTTTKWKDGIDITEPNYDAMVFACDIAALYASPPPPDTAVREALDEILKLAVAPKRMASERLDKIESACRRALAALPPDAGSRK